jgi:hypothetical protein
MCKTKTNKKKKEEKKRNAQVVFTSSALLLCNLFFCMKCYFIGTGKQILSG